MIPSMWGNAFGWIISLLLVVLTIGAAAYVQRIDRPTVATAFSSGGVALEALPLPIPPRNLLPDLTGDVDDATPRVRAAIDAYLADRFTYERAAQGHIPKEFDSLPAIAPVVD